MLANSIIARPRRSGGTRSRARRASSRGRRKSANVVMSMAHGRGDLKSLAVGALIAAGKPRSKIRREWAARALDATARSMMAPGGTAPPRSRRARSRETRSGRPPSAAPGMAKRRWRTSDRTSNHAYGAHCLPEADDRRRWHGRVRNAPTGPCDRGTPFRQGCIRPRPRPETPAPGRTKPCGTESEASSTKPSSDQIRLISSH